MGALLLFFARSSCGHGAAWRKSGRRSALKISVRIATVVAVTVRCLLGPLCLRDSHATIAESVRILSFQPSEIASKPVLFLSLVPCRIVIQADRDWRKHTCCRLPCPACLGGFLFVRILKEPDLARRWFARW